jgi:hypothetical protein
MARIVCLVSSRVSALISVIAISFVPPERANPLATAVPIPAGCQHTVSVRKFTVIATPVPPALAITATLGRQSTLDAILVAAGRFVDPFGCPTVQRSPSF